MKTPNERVSKKLDGVECKLGDGHPLHFVLNVESTVRLEQRRWPGAEMDDARGSATVTVSTT